jgi:hypothetical protein
VWHESNKNLKLKSIKTHKNGCIERRAFTKCYGIASCSNYRGYFL